MSEAKLKAQSEALRQKNLKFAIFGEIKMVN
jgi:hypothetical protein